MSIVKCLIYKECRTYPNYAASSSGHIIRISTGRQLSQYLNGVPAYLTVRVCHSNKAESIRVHRLVADAWLEAPSELHKDVNHKDGNKLNNNLENLEWSTKSQNQRHAIDTGLKQKGSELYNSNFSEEQVHEICKHILDGWLIKDIAEKFDSTKDLIRKIRAGDTYFHIRSLYEIPHNYISDFSESTVRWVCENILKGFSDKSISENSTNTALTIIDIKRIRYKIRYKIISDEYF
jgi:HNH endonuclease